MMDGKRFILFQNHPEEHEKAIDHTKYDVS